MKNKQEEIRIDLNWNRLASDFSIVLSKLKLIIPSFVLTLMSKYRMKHEIKIEVSFL